jgi:hypothetical protein
MADRKAGSWEARKFGGEKPWDRGHGVGRGIGRAVKEDERPTSNIQRPTSNEKINREAGSMGKNVAFGFRIAAWGKMRLTTNNGQLTIP